MRQYWASFRHKKALIIGLVLATLLLIAIFMPLRWAISAFAAKQQSLITAKEAAGTVWSGQIADLQLAGLSIGNVDTQLSVLPLFVGRNEFSVERPAAQSVPPFSAIFVSGADSIGVRTATGTVPSHTRFGPVAISSWEFQDFHFLFDGNRCESAGGNVKIFIHPGMLRGLRLDSGLLGGATCDGNVVHLPLFSQSAMEKIDLRIFANGEYEADVTINTDDPEIGTMLTLAGFAPISGGFALTSKNSF